VILRNTLKELELNPVSDRLSSSASFVSASLISRPNQPRYAAFSASEVIAVPKLKYDERYFNMTDIACARLVVAHTINSRAGPYDYRHPL